MPSRKTTRADKNGYSAQYSTTNLADGGQSPNPSDFFELQFALFRIFCYTARAFRQKGRSGKLQREHTEMTKRVRCGGLPHYDMITEKLDVI